MSNERETSAAALWLVLARSYRAMAGFVEHSIGSLGVGLSEFMILEALLHKGPLTMSELCAAALITNASMTAAIDRLEERRLVERSADTADRRVRRVQLTAEGSALSKRLYARHVKDLDQVMATVPPSDRAELRRQLKAIGLAAQAQSQSQSQSHSQSEPRSESKR